MNAIGQQAGRTCPNAAATDACVTLVNKGQRQPSIEIRISHKQLLSDTWGVHVSVCRKQLPFSSSSLSLHVDPLI